MKPRARWLAPFGLALAVVAAAPRAHADAPEEARVHFLRGVQLFKDADYPSALIEFNRAYAVAPNYRVKYNVGYTCFELRDYPCALRALQQYLTEGGSEVSADRRDTVANDVRRLQVLVVRLKIEVNQPGAEIAVDDAVVGTSPLPEEVLLVGGRHKVTVSLPPRPTVIRFVEVAAGDSTLVDIKLAEAAVTPAAPVAAAPPPDGREPASEPSKVPLVIGGTLTVLLAGGAAATGFMTLSARSDLDATANRFGVTPGDVAGARDDVKTMGLLTDVFAGAAVVVGVGTIVYYFVTKPSAKATATAVPLRYTW